MRTPQTCPAHTRQRATGSRTLPACLSCVVMLCRQRHCRSTLQCVGKTACTQIAYTSAHCLLDCCHWLHLTALPPPDSSTALGVEDTSTMERATASANNIDPEVINEAITIVAGAQFCISREESVFLFDGLSIRQQLSILTSMKGLPLIFHDEIAKQVENPSQYFQ